MFSRHAFSPFLAGVAAVVACSTPAAEPVKDSGAVSNFLSCDEPVGVQRVRMLSTAPRAWTPIEFAVDCTGKWTNPFDPDQVTVRGVFRTPQGRREEVDGFFYRGFERRRDKDGSERLTATGDVGWRIRYIPRSSGRFSLTVEIRNQGRSVRGSEFSFGVAPGEGDGFIRVARANPHYFETDSGKAYFAVGENVCWPGNGGTYDYDKYWERLAGAGANYARIWVGPFDCFTLERTAKGAQDPAGLGRIDLAAAWRLDYVLDRARAHGIRVMFCIESFNSLRIRPKYAKWDQCPYNKANGGPLERPEDFFTHPEARRLFRRRLRYIAARWAAEPAVLSWEFWNEVNIIEKYVSRDVAAWHREMARYLRAADPWDHLITTSWAGVKGDVRIDGLPEIEYIQSHQYGAHDPAEYMIRICLEKARRFQKPHYFGEFGTDWQAKDTRGDREGVHLHNGLWSGVVSMAAGTAMIWWWDNYVDPFDLYHQFRGVSRFVRDIPFHRVQYRPADIGNMGWQGEAPPPRYSDLELHGGRRSWKPDPANRPNEFVVKRDGTVTHRDRLAGILHGVRNHPDLHNPMTFKVDYARDGRFVVLVRGVSGYGGAALRVSLDDRVVVDRAFPDNEESNETMHQYDGDIAVDVPKGRHTIVVENPGPDWVFVDFMLPGYCEVRNPELKIHGLTAPKPVERGPTAFFWVRHARYTWYDRVRRRPMPPVPPSTVQLRGLPDGEYSAVWFDTGDGEPLRRDPVRVRDGRAVMSIPRIEKDAAVKLYAPGAAQL